MVVSADLQWVFILNIFKLLQREWHCSAVPPSSHDIRPTPLNRTVFKSIKTHRHQEVKKIMHNILQSRNLVSPKLFFATWKKKGARQFGTLSKVFECTAKYLLTLPLSPKKNFCPLHTLYKIQPTSCQRELTRFHSKTTNHLGPPVLQSTSDLNEAGPRINTITKNKAVKIIFQKL